MTDFPKYGIWRGKRVRILYYLGDGRFRILQPDDTQSSAHRGHINFLG